MKDETVVLEAQSTPCDHHAIQHWGDGHFAMNDQGDLVVRHHPHESGVRLASIVQEAEALGLSLPLLIRFNDLLHQRVGKISKAFAKARQDLNYQGEYQLVYPIKANQESEVVTALLNSPPYNLGLEAGSKPELLAVMGVLNQHPSVIVCNGYKDATYIRAALIAQSMGHRVFIVIEKLSEWAIIQQESQRLGLRPLVGVRIRLISKSAGLWENSGGEKSKFGLSATHLLALLAQMSADDKLDCLQMMHCHMGSEIAKIADIAECMQEIGQYFIALSRQGVRLNTLDLGGGLSVDYQGTHSDTGCSMNYGLYEYAATILSAIQKLCREAGLTEPTIITESGRALTAHHAVMITNIIGVEHAYQQGPDGSSHEISVLEEMRTLHRRLNSTPVAESYAKSVALVSSAQQHFIQGGLSLQDKAQAESLFQNICHDLQAHLDVNLDLNPALEAELSERLAAKVFCNLSFFQSLPDAWALNQIFPVLPITQLLNQPQIHCILGDLTCDSDGTLKRYVSNGRLSSTLLLPAYEQDNPYYLGFFLIGAYQEILGNLHNLFGDTHSVAVRLEGDSGFSLLQPKKGDSVADVLSTAHFNCEQLLLSCKQQLERSDLSAEKIQSYWTELSTIFSQSTYLRV